MAAPAFFWMQWAGTACGRLWDEMPRQPIVEQYAPPAPRRGIIV